MWQADKTLLLPHITKHAFPKLIHNCMANWNDLEALCYHNAICTRCSDVTRVSQRLRNHLQLDGLFISLLNTSTLRTISPLFDESDANFEVSWLGKTLASIINTDAELYEFFLHERNLKYRKTSSISRTKSQNINVSCIPLQLPSLNSLKPGIKLRMKM